MIKFNAAIYLISSRKNLLFKCLNFFYENWNQRYDYPVYVHYFGDIYNQKDISKFKYKISENIKFISVKPKIPKNVSEKNLFFNLKNNDYAKKFSSNRLGYLHMCNFTTNITNYGIKGCLSDKLKKYDYLMKFDDESFFKKKINYDLFKVLVKNPYATGYTDNSVNSNKINTRWYLWDFYKRYVKKYKLKPKSKILKKALLLNDSKSFHSLNYATDLALYNIKEFKKNNWASYQTELNKFNGAYKYRWGEIETIGLFAYTHFKNPIKNLNLKKKGYFSSWIPSPYSKIAPSNTRQAEINFVKKIYMHFLYYLRILFK
tara:strand:+ start:1327 stop:2277 length:951 start_codon:yes stop_codon:yes gene_type:complete